MNGQKKRRSAAPFSIGVQLAFIPDGSTTTVADIRAKATGHRQALVWLSASGWTVIHLGQDTVAVVRRVFMPGNRITGKVLLPLLAKVVVRVILEVEQVIFLA